jgi:hypothetical protein
MERSVLIRLAYALAVIVVAPGLLPAHEIVLHSFGSESSPGGSYPWAGVIRDSAGNLYINRAS